MQNVLPVPFAIQIITRLVSIALVITLVLVLPPATALLLFFALALGHMTMAFLYQRDAKKWSYKKLLLAAAGFCVLAIFCNVYPTLGFVVANFTFVFHMLWDEAHLFNRPTSRTRTLEMLPFLVLWGSLFLQVAFGYELFMTAYVISGILVLARIAMLVLAEAKPDIVSYMLWGWTLLALVGSLIVQQVGMLVPASLWFFGLVTVHFFIWYGDYFLRVMNDTGRRTTYLRRVLVTNATSIALALVFVFMSAPVLAIFFSIGFANAWSILHILSSIRFATFRTSFGFAA